MCVHMHACLYMIIYCIYQFICSYVMHIYYSERCSFIKHQNNFWNPMTKVWGKLSKTSSHTVDITYLSFSVGFICSKVQLKKWKVWYKTHACEKMMTSDPWSPLSSPLVPVGPHNCVFQTPRHSHPIGKKKHPEAQWTAHFIFIFSLSPTITFSFPMKWLTTLLPVTSQIP